MKWDTPDKLPDGIVLAFDFGMKRIGVAVGQTVTKTARSYGMLKAEQGEPNWQQVQSIIKEWQPIALVVGIPLNMDGTEQKITQHAKDFAQALNEHTKLPVYGVDERLTTVEARDRIFEQEGYKGLQKASVDAMAAKIILESWLREPRA
jgi:putative Holliday junction resolvase